MPTLAVILTDAQLTRALNAFRLRLQSELETELFRRINDRVFGEEINTSIRSVSDVSKNEEVSMVFENPTTNIAKIKTIDIKNHFKFFFFK